VSRLRLRSHVAKQFLTVVNLSISVAIKCKPAVLRVKGSPTEAGRLPPFQEVEIHAMGRIRHFEPLAAHVDKYWGVTLPLPALVVADRRRTVRRRKRAAATGVITSNHTVAVVVRTAGSAGPLLTEDLLDDVCRT